jgi:hypothetical protein
VKFKILLEEITLEALLAKGAVQHPSAWKGCWLIPDESGNSAECWVKVKNKKLYTQVGTVNLKIGNKK